MKKDNEQYKRMIRIFLVVILVACETSLFMYSWIKNYNLYTVFPFFQKGHWMMGGMYLFLPAVLDQVSKQPSQPSENDSPMAEIPEKIREYIISIQKS